MSDQARWKDRARLALLNQDLVRLDAPVKVTGQARYTSDVRVPGMLFVRLVLHPYPRLRVKRVEVSGALSVPGVVAARGIKGAGDTVLYQGDDGVLAWVAAETPEAAADGVRAVRVEASTLYPPVVNREQALAAEAPEVLGPGEPNRSHETRSGDEAATLEALERAPVQVDATYTCPVQHHVCLEPHGYVVDARIDSATVYASTQMVSASAGLFARPDHLDLPAGSVRVVCEHMGGGFGSKFMPGLEGRLAARIAREVGAPVRLMLTRREEFLMAGNRSGSRQVLRAGADEDGRLLALWVDAERFGGVGPGALPRPPYRYPVPQTYARLASVHTATDSSRAMRAPGHPQAAFAMESMLDEVAYAAEVDPLEVRKRNLEDEVWHRQLDRVAREIGWFTHTHRTAPDRRRGGVNEGIGFGVTGWSAASRPGTGCEVRVHPDGSVTASVATQDLGTGSRTLVAAIVAEELGLDLARVDARIGDSDLPPSVPSGGSVTTPCLAPAVQDAAHRARVALEALLGGEAQHWADGLVHPVDRPEEARTFEQVCSRMGDEPLVVRGEHQPDLAGAGVHGAQAARVRVDTLTGELHVTKMVAVQDVGLPLNRAAVRSQLNGGMIQALSYALLEQRVHDPDLGLMLTGDLETYKIAGTLEVPELVAIVDDEDRRQAVFGMAEAPVIPGAAAIANALFNACGARVRDLPLTPDRVLGALEETR